jgi:ketosteroid isomerase-like protein
MSQETVELVRRFLELASRTDLRSDEWPHLQLLAEDVVYHPVQEMAEARECRGREDFRRLMEDFYLQEWSDDLSWKATSFSDRGDQVIVRMEMSGHGRASGAGFSGRIFAVYTVRDGEIVQVDDFIERADALQAVGLRDE